MSKVKPRIPVSEEKPKKPTERELGQAHVFFVAVKVYEELHGKAGLNRFAETLAEAMKP